MAPLTLIGWILALGLFYEGVAPLHGVIALLSFTAYAATGNFAAFFEIAAAARLDDSRQRICLLPFLVLGFAVSIFSVSRACRLAVAGSHHRGAIPLGQDRAVSDHAMSPALATVLLVLLAGILFVLPLLPALIELRLKRDAHPLNVIQQYAGEIRHFSYGFRVYIEALLEPLQKCVASGTTIERRYAGRRRISIARACRRRAFLFRREKDAELQFDRGGWRRYGSSRWNYLHQRSLCRERIQ